MIQATTLQDWCARYALRHGLEGKSAYVFGHSLTIFEAWLNRPATIADLDNDTASQFIQSLEATYAPSTRAGIRANILGLWRFIADETKGSYPGRIRRAPKPEPQPVAWTLDELRKLRIAATEAKGIIFGSGCSRSLYLVTLLDAAYESGLRRGDLWRLEQGNFLANGIIVTRQHKTSWPHEPQLQPDTLARVRQLVGKFPLRWPGVEKGFYECWRIWMIRPSGVRPGVLQQIRRTGATQIESIRPHETQRYLGHKTPTMKKHYVDRSQAYGPAPQPPKFWW